MTYAATFHKEAMESFCSYSGLTVRHSTDLPSPATIKYEFKLGLCIRSINSY